MSYLERFLFLIFNQNHARKDKYDNKKTDKRDKIKFRKIQMMKIKRVNDKLKKGCKNMKEQ